jgi:hypothetical protein
MDTKTTTYEVNGAIDVIVGELVISRPDDRPGNFFTGMGTRIYLDGHELQGVRSLTLHMVYDEAVKITVEQLVRS